MLLWELVGLKRNSPARRSCPATQLRIRGRGSLGLFRRSSWPSWSATGMLRVRRIRLRAAPRVATPLLSSRWRDPRRVERSKRSRGGGMRSVVAHCRAGSAARLVEMVGDEAASRVSLERSAMIAAASTKMLETSSARWWPAVRAAAFGAWVARRCWVRLVAIAEKIASPRALPICLAAVSSAAARPAWCAGGVRELGGAVECSHAAPWIDLGQSRPRSAWRTITVACSRGWPVNQRGVQPATCARKRARPSAGPR